MRPEWTYLNWWPGRELNPRHADFQSFFVGLRGLSINHLQRLSPLFPGTSRHNPGTVNLSWSQSWHSQSELVTILAQRSSCLGGKPRASPLSRQGDNLPLLPNVDRNTVHTGSSARVLRSSAQSAPNLRCSRGGRLAGSLDLHSLFSRSRGSRPELSYTVHTSASG